jgi:glycosyltransferase involved in cell wall biosynthesis
VLYNPILYRVTLARIIRRMSSRPRGLEARNVKEELERIFGTHGVDLIVLHYVGGADSAAIIHEANKRGIPFVVLNHFSNDRFNHMSIREQIRTAAGIAGVSAVGVPGWLAGRFVNLSDGIDTKMFCCQNGQHPERESAVPVLFLPARIVPTKGQSDLIKAGAALKLSGLNFRIVLAGRADSIEYENELRALAGNLGMADRVFFAGQLDQTALIHRYARSSILAFPTYHHEGLPRILMEAQSMEVPPVAYDIGGMSEGIRNGDTGFLVKKGDLAGFTKRLHELLTDEAKRKSMGERGRKFIEGQFSLEALAARHEAFYVQAIRKAASRNESAR